MDIARKLGILIVFGVPAIMGGGIIYHFFGSYIPVVIFEAILYVFAFDIVSK